MFDFLKKKGFLFKYSFNENTISFSLYESDRKFHIPLKPSEKEVLFKWDKEKLKSLEKLENTVKRLSYNELDAETIKEFKNIFSEKDLIEPAFSIKGGEIHIAYKTLSAIRFNGLLEEIGEDRELLNFIDLPEYSRIRFNIETKGSFNQEKFKITYSLINQKSEKVYIDKIVGHSFTCDLGNTYLLTPSEKMLIERLNKHDELTKNGLIDSIEKRYKEFSEIKTLSKNVNANTDKFTKDTQTVFLDEIPYIIGRDLDEKIIIHEALPIDYTSFDDDFIKQLDEEGQDAPNKSRYILTDKDGHQIFVSMSDKAKLAQKKISALKKKTQVELEEVYENHHEYLSGAIDRSLLSETFSDRVSGFIFGRPKNISSEQRKSGDWGDGHDLQSVLLRTTEGKHIEVNTKPVPELYNALKNAEIDLLIEIEDSEIKKRVENDSFLTPLPPEKDKEIYIDELEASFNLRTIINMCKRIENENIPDLNDDDLIKANEQVELAISEGDNIIHWSTFRDGEYITDKIPTISLRKALPKNKKSSETVSLAIDESENKFFNFDSLRLAEESTELEVPPMLKDGIKLFSHQSKGYNWLIKLLSNPELLNNKNRSGALLADDMGLGKTLQVISLISYMKDREDFKQKPILVVAPVSLIDGSWIKEGILQFVKDSHIGLPGSRSKYQIKKFSDCKYKYSKQELYAEAKKLNYEIESEGKSLIDCEISQKLRDYLENIKDWCSNDIILTSYETLRSKSIEFGSIDFSLVVLDEAQKIKNHGTLQSNAARALKADMYLAMTGTPIENSIIDLFSIMDFVFPYKLGTKQSFRNKYVAQLNSSPAGSEEREHLRKELINDLSPLWMRRTKKDVFTVGEDIPEIVHYDSIPDEKGSLSNLHNSYMSEEQEVVYLEQVGLFQHAKKDYKLAALRGMLEACYAPWLSLGLEVSWENHEELFKTCPKLKTTFDILDKIYQNNSSEGNKVILFANMVQVQNSLAWLIKEWVSKTKNKEIEVEVYNNKASPLKRVEMLKRFEEGDGFQAIIISPRAGGAGLNIQAANHVIHYTREWNPALERQATDRAYRIGQKRTVHVYYPTTISQDPSKPCSEEELAKILARKRDIMDDFTIVSGEIKPDEFSESVKQDVNTENIKIGINDLENIDDKQFESFAACLLELNGYKTEVVGKSGDSGVDVIAYKDGENYLIQVKHTRSKNNIPAKCIDEVRGGKSYYESKLSKKFNLAVITNYHFREDTFTKSKEGDFVELWDISFISKILKKHKISLKEINQKLGI